MFSEPSSILQRVLYIEHSSLNALAKQEPSITPFAFSGKGDIYQHSITNREYDIKLDQKNKTRDALYNEL